MARRTLLASAAGGTPRVSCQATVASSSSIAMPLANVPAGQRRGRRPKADGGTTAAPVVDLARGEPAKAGEARLAAVGTGQQGGEFGMQQRAHGALTIDVELPSS